MTDRSRYPKNTLHALRLIGASDLTGMERDLLRTLLEWADVQEWTLFPSVRTIASNWGRSTRTVQRTMGALRGRGIVEYLRESRGGAAPNGAGRTHTIRIRWERLNRDTESGSDDDNPDTPSGLDRENPDTASPSPRHSDAPTLTDSRSQGVTVTDKQTIHPTKEQARETEGEADRARCRENGWMGDAPAEGKTLRGTLQERGIRGPNLEALSGSNLTPDEARDEWRSVVSDPTVRNQQAVFVDRLEKRAGITLKRRPKLAPEDRAAVAGLERLRRSQGGGRDDSERMGDLLAEK